MFFSRRFQRRIHGVLCVLEGVINAADDIIVVGWGKSLSEATYDRDCTVIELMDQLSLHGLRLNPDKIKFNTCTAPFIGHIQIKWEFKWHLHGVAIRALKNPDRIGI